MKRFTETSKWDDPWFWELSTPAKLIYLFLLDHCDNAGVADCNLKLASLKIGETVNQETITELGERLQRMPNGKLHLVKFVRYQFGSLKPSSNLHASVIDLLNRHGLPLPESGGLGKPSCSPPVALEVGSRGSVMGPSKGTVKVKVQSEQGWGNIGLLREGLNGLFDRGADFHWSYDEEHALAAVARRHDALEELADLRNYQRLNPQYFPNSLSALLTDWTKHLDAAKSHKSKQTTSKPKTIAEKEMDAMEKQIRNL